MRWLEDVENDLREMKGKKWHLIGKYGRQKFKSPRLSEGRTASE